MLTSYIVNGKITCPYCGSSNHKAMRAYTRKYPRPEMPAVATDSYHQELYNWQNGYVCQKCGREYLAILPPISSPPPQPVAYQPQPVVSQPLPPTKSGSFLGKLILWIVIFALAIMAWVWYQSHNKPTKSKQVKAKTDKTMTAKSATPATDKKADIVVPPEPTKADEPPPEPTKPAPEPVKEPEPPKPQVTKDEKGEVNIEHVEAVKTTETRTITKAN